MGLTDSIQYIDLSYYLDYSLLISSNVYITY
jgi:hypothetical protein